MSIGTTNRPQPFSELDLRTSLRNLDLQSGDTTATRVANPNIIYPGMLVRVHPVQNRRNITVERILAAARGNTPGSDGINAKGEFFGDLALPILRRNGQLSTGVLEAVAAAEINDFARETAGGPQNYSRFTNAAAVGYGYGPGGALNVHGMPIFAVCSEAIPAQNSAGQLVNAVLPGNFGTFTVRGHCNLTMNAGAAAATAVGVVNSTAYGAGSQIYLDSSDNFQPKIIPVNEAGTAIATQPVIAIGDIVVGYLTRRIDAAEFTVAGTVQVPVFFMGHPCDYEFFAAT